MRTGQAHRSQRCLHGKRRAGTDVWLSDAVVLQPYRDYRLEGWIRCSSGEARLRIDLVDAAGRIVRNVESPLAQGDEWRSYAVEWNAGSAAAGRVAFWVKGEADLDNVSLALVETSFMGNKSVEGAAVLKFPVGTKRVISTTRNFRMVRQTGGRAPSYRTSEPWLVHNLFYLLAASALDRAVRD